LPGVRTKTCLLFCVAGDGRVIKIAPTVAPEGRKHLARGVSPGSPAIPSHSPVGAAAECLRRSEYPYQSLAAVAPAGAGGGVGQRSRGSRRRATRCHPSGVFLQVQHNPLAGVHRPRFERKSGQFRHRMSGGLDSKAITEGMQAMPIGKLTSPADRNSSLRGACRVPPGCHASSSGSSPVRRTEALPAGEAELYRREDGLYDREAHQSRVLKLSA